MRISVKKTSILFSIILLAFVVFGFASPSEAQACTVENARFILPIGVENPAVGQPVIVQVDTVDCNGQAIEVQVREGKRTEYTTNSQVNNQSQRVVELDDILEEIPIGAEGRVKVTLVMGESQCDTRDDPDCRYFLRVRNAANNNLLWISAQSTQAVGGELRYNCNGACSQDWEYQNTISYESYGVAGGTGGTDNSEFESCEIVSMSISPHGEQTTWTDSSSGWYIDGDNTAGAGGSAAPRPSVTITIKTSGCAEQLMTVNLQEKDGPRITQVDPVSPIENRVIKVDDRELVKIVLKPGETKCEGGECWYTVSAQVPGDSKTISSVDDQLKYDCYGTCNERWDVVSIIPEFNPQGNGNVFISGDGTVTPLVGNECASGNCSLLSPLPGFEELDADPEVGRYVTVMVRIFIGIATLLAVIMIVVGGVQYMTTDAIGGKQTARTTITNAILGLLLALGSWVILNTINPNLLNINFSPGDVTIQYQGGPAVLNADGTFSLEPGGEPIAVNGVVMQDGDPWPQFAVQAGLVNIRQRAEELGYKINANDCGTIGQPGCTTLYFSPSVANTLLSQLTAMKSSPELQNKVVRITGGSEFWLHKTHHPDKAILDFGVVHTQGVGPDDEAALNTFLFGVSEFPGECTAKLPVGSAANLVISLLDESRTKCPGWSPAPHWHVKFR